MMQELSMPSREEVEIVLLNTLFSHNGTVKEFNADEDIVQEIADNFDLSNEQKTAYLETIYKKENRVKKANLWHRLLFRAADSLAKHNLVSRPTQTIRVTERKEWMLTEQGYEKALMLANFPISEKEKLSVKSFEVEKFAKQLTKRKKPKNYNPIGRQKTQVTNIVNLRSRSFRQAIIEAYNFKCAVCGLKIHSPRNHRWEVEAAHIIPHSYNGKDDIWNGLSLCRIHHWAFDVGWYSLDQELRIIASEHIHQLPDDMGKAWNYDLVRFSDGKETVVQLPKKRELWPDLRAVQWHRENVFQKY